MTDLSLDQSMAWCAKTWPEINAHYVKFLSYILFPLVYHIDFETVCSAVNLCFLIIENNSIRYNAIINANDVNCACEMNALVCKDI